MPSTPSTPAVGTIAVAVVTAANWALSQYVFKGSEPSAIAGLVTVGLPAGIAWLATSRAKKEVPPGYMQIPQVPVPTPTSTINPGGNVTVVQPNPPGAGRPL